MIRPSVPEHVEATLEQALEKLPADRMATAREFADGLLGKSVLVSTTRRTAARAASRRNVVTTYAPWLVAIAAVAAAVIGWSRRPSPVAERLIRFIVNLDPGVRLATAKSATPTETDWTFEDVVADKSTPCRASFCASSEKCIASTGHCTATSSACPDKCASGTACIEEDGAASCEVEAFAEAFKECSVDAVAECAVDAIAKCESAGTSDCEADAQGACESESVAECEALCSAAVNDGAVSTDGSTRTFTDSSNEMGDPATNNVVTSMPTVSVSTVTSSWTAPSAGTTPVP
jgi:hypothetical protein